MKVYRTILGNIRTPEWASRLKDGTPEYIGLDQWTAQKSRFVGRGDRGNEYAVALERNTRLSDGDIIDYDPATGGMAVVRISLSDVLAADLGGLAGAPAERIIRTALELGHAVGNQHWAAVVKGMQVYIPLTVDRKVMESVMRTHAIEGVEWSFRRGDEIIPYLAPHEIRRLFGGSGGHSHEHSHDHSHSHGHSHCGPGREHHPHSHEEEHPHAAGR